ncbi:MAG: thiamine phosphate synthase [Candidatus Diapherotrites archaeon]
MISEWEIYLITDSSLTKRTIFEDVRDAVDAGVKVVQYREKNKSIDEMIEEAMKIKEICKAKNVDLIINNYIEVMLAVDAEGVHLGQDDMPLEDARKSAPGKIIGVTVHNSKEAIEAEKNGASYVAVSPIFESSTKSDAGKAVGVEMIREVKKEVSLPIIAIGGINESNLREVVSAGADAAAIISDILKEDDVKGKIERLRGIMNDTAGKGKE